MSPVEVIAAIRTRLAGVTQAPWVRAPWHDGTILPKPWTDDTLPCDDRGPFSVVTASEDGDAEFIAGAPDDVARLLTVAEAAVTVILGPLPEGGFFPALDALARAVAGLGDGVPEP